VALAAALPSAPLLVLDLGRPLRFLHMLRIFKPRSPMSMGAWCLAAFSGAATLAVGADILGHGKPARALGAATVLLGTYLGSYTGVLLAATAVPVWARSRALLRRSLSARNRNRRSGLPTRAGGQRTTGRSSDSHGPRDD
jgi:formate-dependent nitrite reductase membrane component NrfD